MSALIHALYETGMAIVVRYVFRNNSSPRLCALFPHIKPDYEVSSYSVSHDTSHACTCVHWHILRLVNIVSVYS